MTARSPIASAAKTYGAVIFGSAVMAAFIGLVFAATVLSLKSLGVIS